MVQEEQAIRGRKEGKKCKLMAVLSIIVVCLAVATGVFVWKFIDQRNEVESLRTLAAEMNNELAELRYEGSREEAQDVAGDRERDPNVVTEAELREALVRAGYDDDNMCGEGYDWVLGYSQCTRVAVVDFEIENSSVTPWQTVRGAVNNASAWFYRTGPGAEWNLGFVTQNAFMCWDGAFMATPNRMRAFADFSCVLNPDTLEMSTVGENARW